MTLLCSPKVTHQNSPSRARCGSGTALLPVGKYSNGNAHAHTSTEPACAHRVQGQGDSVSRCDDAKPPRAPSSRMIMPHPLVCTPANRFLRLGHSIRAEMGQFWRAPTSLSLSQHASGTRCCTVANQSGFGTPTGSRWHRGRRQFEPEHRVFSAHASASSATAHNAWE